MMDDLPKTKEEAVAFIRDHLGRAERRPLKDRTELCYRVDFCFGLDDGFIETEDGDVRAITDGDTVFWGPEANKLIRVKFHLRRFLS